MAAATGVSTVWPPVFRNQHVGEVAEVYVRPDHRGLGIGRDLLARFGITGDVALQPVANLSGGERCRAALARLAAAEAAVSGFAMTLGGKLVQGEVLEASEARRIYEGIVRRRRDPGLLDGTPDSLRSPDIQRLAIANPKIAPYGNGAMQIIGALQLTDALTPKLVRGDSIAQAYQFVVTGNAQAGFVAMSQVADDAKGSRWIPPRSMYDPIHQDAVLLRPGNTAAEAFIAYLQGDTAKETIRRYGYEVD